MDGTHLPSPHTQPLWRVSRCQQPVDRRSRGEEGGQLAVASPWLLLLVLGSLLCGLDSPGALTRTRCADSSPTSPVS